MIHPSRPFPFAILALTASIPAFAQSIVSTHSGAVYFFEGSAFIDDQPLEQKFGKFPDIGEGRELRTEHGRAEVLLTPGVFLRVDENSVVKMLSVKLTDTRVELIAGSAIVEADEAAPNASVTVLCKNWQVKLPQTGVYRLDSKPAQVRVYKGEAEVSALKTDDGLKKDDSLAEKITVSQGQTLPLAAILVPEQSAIVPGDDPFKNWAMGRSQMISSDNATAAGIVDDPSLIDDPGGTLAGLSYFPMTGIPSLGMTNPYGVSFWSPFQSRLTAAMYYPTFMYGYMYTGWPTSVHYLPYQPGRLVMPARIGGVVRPGVIAPMRPVYVPSPGVRPAPHVVSAPMRLGAHH